MNTWKYFTKMCNNGYQSNPIYEYYMIEFTFRESDPMVESDKKAAPASILKQPNPSAGKRQRAPHIKQTVRAQDVRYRLNISWLTKICFAISH